MAPCGGLEERIDRRSRGVLPGTPVQSNAPVLEEHVLVTRCQVDLLGADDFVIFRLDDGVGRSSTEYRGQPAGRERPATVNDRCDGAAVILGKMLQQSTKGTDIARGATHRDDGTGDSFLVQARTHDHRAVVNAERRPNRGL